MVPLPDAATIRRHLLGTATEAETDAIERAVLALDAALEAVCSVEEELISDYLDGTFAPDLRHRFESVYLASHEHRLRLEIARGLRRVAVRPRRSFAILRLTAAAAALLAMAIAGLWYLRPPKPPGAPVFVTLEPVYVRGAGGVPTAKVTAGTTGVVLRLSGVEAPAAHSLTVSITTVEGMEVWRGSAAASPDGEAGSDRRTATDAIPATVLPAGDYIAVVTDGEHDDRELQRYFFRVVRP